MDSKMKMVVGIAVVLGIVSVVFFAAPTQAYFNGNINGDLLQTQDRDRLRTQDCDCNCDSTQTQYHSWQRTHECSAEGICNCTMRLEQFRNQNIERIRSLLP